MVAFRTPPRNEIVAGYVLIIAQDLMPAAAVIPCFIVETPNPAVTRLRAMMILKQ